jgi:hypothetical protein
MGGDRGASHPGEPDSMRTFVREGGSVRRRVFQFGSGPVGGNK